MYKLTGEFRLKYGPSIISKDLLQFPLNPQPFCDLSLKITLIITLLCQIKHSLYLLSDEDKDDSASRDIVSSGFIQHLAH